MYAYDLRRSVYSETGYSSNVTLALNRTAFRQAPIKFVFPWSRFPSRELGDECSASSMKPHAEQLLYSPTHMDNCILHVKEGQIHFPVFSAR